MKKMLIGLIIGIVTALAAVTILAPKLMVKEMASPYGYEETITYIRQQATDAGWKVSAVMRMDQSLAKEGKPVLPAASLKICQPDYAETILNDDKSRFLSVMMPCSIAVYEKADGKTYVSTMNVKLMGKLFGGTVAEVMAGPVAKETAGFVRFK